MENICEDDVIVCMDEEGGWDNIQYVDLDKRAIIFGGGSPFSDE